MNLKSVLSIAAALIVAVVIVPLIWKIVQEKSNDRLISNWKVCDVHTTSIYTTRGSGGVVRLEWQKRHSISLSGGDGGAPSMGMTDEDLRTCLLMKEDEVK